VDIAIVSNGPGEVWGWALPLARALRRLSPPPRVTLTLPPCQYATGHEAAVARRSDLFDGIEPPARVLRLILGLGDLRADCVVHLGGDLWYAARLARRAGCPAIAYVERTLIARRHRPFAWIATSTEDLGRRLVALGVPETKVEPVGDLRVDALEIGYRISDIGQLSTLNPRLSTGLIPPTTGHRPLLLLLPGSRPRIFEGLAPLMADVGERVRGLLPEVEVAMAPSPFLPDGIVQRSLKGASLRVITGDAERLESFRRADLALTIPGTSTVELGLLGTPMLVWMPFYDPSRIPLEGLKEWLLRFPVIGPAVKGFLLRRYFSVPRFVAVPNRLTGARLVEEIVGDAPPDQVAERIAQLLADGERLRAMREGLREQFPARPGAAEHLARRVVEIASRTSGNTAHGV
jgi:lipid-A-disaccharide synthase